MSQGVKLPDRRYAVIVDEAHSSQTGESVKDLKTVLGATELARSHALRGADSVHLASALAIGDPDLVLAVWDRRLHTGAQAAHLAFALLHHESHRII